MNIQVSAKHYTNASEVIAAARERKRRIEDDSFFARKYREEKAKNDELRRMAEEAEMKIEAASKAENNAWKRAEFFETQNMMLIDTVSKMMLAGGKHTPATVTLNAPSSPRQPIPQHMFAGHPVRNYIARRSRELGIPYADVVGPSRQKDVAFARQLIMWEIKKEFRPETSFPDLGRFFGGRDHSTCCHAINKIQALKDAGAIA